MTPVIIRTNFHGEFRAVCLRAVHRNEVSHLGIYPIRQDLLFRVIVSAITKETEELSK